MKAGVNQIVCQTIRCGKPAETDESLAWRRDGIGVDVVRKLRRGVWAIQQQLDLHGMRTDEARAKPGPVSTRGANQRLALCARGARQRPGLSRSPTRAERQRSSAGWCKANACWPLCRPVVTKAVPVPWYCCWRPPRATFPGWKQPLGPRQRQRQRPQAMSTPRLRIRSAVCMKD